MDDTEDESPPRPRYRAKGSVGARPTVKKSSRPNAGVGRQISMTDLLLPVLKWTLAIIRIFFYILRIPIALGFALLAMVYLYRFLLLPAICSVKYADYFISSCQSGVPQENPYFAKVIRQDHELAEMQQMASDNAVLPYRLLLGQSSLKDLVLELSAVDTPSKNKLMPLLGEYNDLVEEVVDGIQDSLSSTDSLVDNVILTNTWAENQLQTISDHETSIMAPAFELANVAGKWSGLSIPGVSTEAEVQTAFYEYTNNLQDEAGKVLLRYQGLRGKMTSLKNLLDTMALGFRTDGIAIEEEKLGQASYWKWILRSHRGKMRDFDKKMELCAAFYSHSREGGKIIEITIFRLQEMRGRIRSLRDELKTASLPSPGKKEASLQLTIDRLKASVKYLESSKQKSVDARKERMIEFKKQLDI